MSVQALLQPQATSDFHPQTLQHSSAPQSYRASHSILSVASEPDALPHSQHSKPAHLMSPLFSQDPVSVRGSTLPAAKTESNGDDLPLGAQPRQTRLKKEASLRRKSASLHAADPLSTIVLKPSIHVETNAHTRNQQSRASSSSYNKRLEPKSHKPATVNSQQPQLKTGKIKKRNPKTSRRGNDKKRTASNGRKILSQSLIDLSGDEDSDVDFQSKARTRSQSNRNAMPNSVRKESSDDSSSGKPRKRKLEKEANNSSSDRNTPGDNEISSKIASKRRRTTTQQPETGAANVGVRQSPRLAENREAASQSRREPSRSNCEAVSDKQKRKHASSSEHLDNISNDKPMMEKGYNTDSSDDFLPTSERSEQFEKQKAKWRDLRENKRKSSATDKEKATPRKSKSKKRKRTGGKKSASDGEFTDDCVEDGSSDSDSQRPSQKESQPLEVKITSLSTLRRRRKTDFEEERKHLSTDELSDLRLAFVNHYPPPPSNAQAQGRFEMKYGREMSQSMIKGIWEKELKSWSERWWTLYTEFNKEARGKKLAKPVDKNPTITTTEAAQWAQEFYNVNGEARRQQDSVLTPTEEKTSRQPVEDVNSSAGELNGGVAKTTKAADEAVNDKPTPAQSICDATNSRVESDQRAEALKSSNSEDSDFVVSTQVIGTQSRDS